MGTIARYVLCALALCAPLVGCASTERQLQRVAKDWCMTIRASQVLPVYPLSEDIQPGDVFVVQVPLSEQPKIYRQKGFLALDQLATRLGKMRKVYRKFYADSYWEGTYSEVPHSRPVPRPAEDVPDAGAPGGDAPGGAAPQAEEAAPQSVDEEPAPEEPGGEAPANQPGGDPPAEPADDPPPVEPAEPAEPADDEPAEPDRPRGVLPPGPLVEAPRAAFPSYNFSVQRGAGLKLAIPLSGVPVGLGLMNASRAQGSVAIQDAYTYGADIESLVRKLGEWWGKSPEVQAYLGNIASQTDSEVYLRVVNRVYLTRRVVVSLSNLDSTSVGADAGAASIPKLLDFTDKDASQVKTSGKAYQEALSALSGPLNAATPGGSFRFTQASQRSVTMEETFDRPLVIGYLGFDVKVNKDGTLSPPIPSFAVLNGEVQDFPPPLPYEPNELSKAYDSWLDETTYPQVAQWLDERDMEDIDPGDLAHSARYLPLLRALAADFGGFEKAASEPEPGSAEPGAAGDPQAPAEGGDGN